MTSPQNNIDNPVRFTPEEIADALAVIQDVFKQFRSHILEQAGKSGHTDKLDGSPVTDTDVEVEKALQAIMKDRFPTMSVFGEETGYGEDLPNAFWLIDPIDGTENFIKNIPTFTCVAVFIQDKQAVASVIYNPSSDIMFTALKSRGAYKNETQLDLTKLPLPHVALCKGRFIDVLADIVRPKGVQCEIAPTGGSFGFTMVAEGLAAARFQMWSRGYTHDYAPGALIIEEAGGIIIPIKESRYTYKSRSFVACHPELAPTIRANLAAIRNLERD